MTCAVWEEQVALFAGGDLGTAEAAAVERHLSQCAACSALAADLRAELDDLREAHAEPVAAAHYAVVRTRVLAELAVPPRRRVVWPWAWAAVLAAAAAVLVAVMMKPAAVPAPGLPRVAMAPTQSGADAPVRARPPGRATERDGGINRSLAVTAPKPVGTRPERTPVSVRGPAHTEMAGLPAIEGQRPAIAYVAPPAPPAVDDSPVQMVQLATDDPNVVIYWQLEGTGE